ncbi:MAG: HD domain-containing protein [Candidatus Micrarchaeia archaeon]
MYIRDAVFGNVDISEAELKLIEDSHMQRLRYIKQLSFAYLVYPGAEHTRFEHSIGAMHVTGEIVDKIFGKDTEEELKVVGLMHDIGVAPYSHSSDHILLKYLRKTHEQIGAEIIKESSIRDAINSSTLSLKKILSYFNGESKGSFVTGAIGSDRIDYLMRDSYHTGVAYGIIDFNRIKGKITSYKGSPAVFEEGIQGAESLLIARYFMFSSVYLHHTAIIASLMFERALEAALDAGRIFPGELTELNDETLTFKLASIDVSRNLIGRISRRQLYKRAYYKELKNGNANVDEIAKALDRNGFDSESYVISVYGFKGEGDDLAVISKDGSYLGTLKELSPLVSTLSAILRNKKMLIVACDPRDREEIRKIVEKSL